MEAFLLGLSNGGLCIAYCAPVLVPYLLGRGRGIAPNFGIIALFLLGRLAGYSIFSLFAYGLHLALQNNARDRSAVVGITYIVLSIFLMIWGFHREKAGSSDCAMHHSGVLVGKINRLIPQIAPALIGFLTGLTLCPPFLIAFAAASQKGSLTGSFLFFMFFFCGTSVFFLPFPLIGALQRFKVLSVIGRLSTGIVGAWYFYSGLVLLVQVL